MSAESIKFIKLGRELPQFSATNAEFASIGPVNDQDEKEHEPQRERNARNHNDIGSRGTKCRSVGDYQDRPDQTNKPQDGRHSGFAMDQPIAPETDKVV